MSLVRLCQGGPDVDPEHIIAIEEATLYLDPNDGRVGRVSPSEVKLGNLLIGTWLATWVHLDTGITVEAATSKRNVMANLRKAATP